MERSTIIIFTLVFYKLFLIIVGWSTRKKNITIEDYFIGGRRLGPIITSISYSASNSSAWTLLGVSGIAFSQGISTLWLVVGVIGGMFISWLKVAPSIYEITKKKKLITIPQLIADGYHDNEKRNILLLSSFIIIFSFSFYIASQFQGAGNALNDTFGLNIVESIFISALVIYVYTYLGGYLAVSITDTIQGFLMAFTALIMPLMAISKIGGFSEFFRELSMESGDFLSLSAGNIGLSALGLIVGHLGIGIGYFGQPHLLSRFISVRDLNTLKKSKNYALIWFCIVFIGMWLLGIAGHFLVDDLSNNENIFFRISNEIFHPVVQGVLLAAVISAIMSTADSQILVCSSSISVDLGIKNNSLKLSRIVTGIVILCSALIAIMIPDKIFTRVLFAWTAMGSAFGPSVISKILKWNVSASSVLLSILIGFVFAVLLFLLPNTPGDWLERVVPFALGFSYLFFNKK